MTLTWSKAKVTGLLNFWKFYFSTLISSAILACSSKLMADHDSTGSSLQPVRARFSNFLFEEAITWVQTSRNISIMRISNGHISVLLEAMVTCSGTLVVLYVLHILMWPSPDQRSRSRSVTWKLQFSSLSPLFWHDAHNWWVITTSITMFYRTRVYPMHQPNRNLHISKIRFLFMVLFTIEYKVGTAEFYLYMGFCADLLKNVVTRARKLPTSESAHL